MIREFSVKNFLSISEEQTLSFVTNGPESELVAMMPDGTYLYKLGVLYGANASGKSNMLWALNNVFSMLVTPKSDAQNEIRGYMPFAFRKDDSTSFYVSFYADGIRYDYTIEFNKYYILKELLYYYPNKSKALFYSRTYVGEHVQADIKFGSSLHLQNNTQVSIRENVLNNHSVLSVCRKNAFKKDIEVFSKLHTWVMQHYHEVDGDPDRRSVVEILKDASLDSKKYKFFCLMLKKADLNITDYRMIMEDRNLPKTFWERIEKENIPQEVKEELLRPTVESVVFQNNSARGTFEIPIKLQSKGTLKYIRLLDNLYDLIRDSHVYYLDELGENLHYDLLYYYLSVFIYNSGQSQLLITSQETTLLSQDLINENRGVVWFVEKNEETAASVYNRGDSFGLHKNMSLFNSYRIGRLGAKPLLGSIFLDLED